MALVAMSRLVLCVSSLRIAVCLLLIRLAASSSQDIWEDLVGRELQDTTSCNDARRWGQMPWNYLSYQESRSWTSLGWNQLMWDRAHPIPTTTAAMITTTFGRRMLRGYDGSDEDKIGAEDEESDQGAGDRRLQFVTSTLTPTTTSTTVIPMSETMCYQDLNEGQQDAVRTLGYSITTWHACKNPTCPWPPGIPKPDASCLEVRHWLNNGLYTRTWVDLPTDKRDALELLGWSNTRWNEWNHPLTYAKLWADLLPRQQEAARFLGYTPDAWERCEKAASCIERLALLENTTNPFQRPWSVIPRPLQDRYAEIGYDEKRWMNGDGPKLNKQYIDLLPHEIVAVRIVGYVSDTWDGCPLSQCTERYAYVKARYETKMWTQLTVAQRRAWQLLGHNARLWTDGGMFNTISFQSTWAELSNEQQQQAMFLGHSEGTWQGCSTQWGKPDPNATQNTPTSGVISTSIERTVRARMTIRRPFAEVSGNVYGAAVARLPSSFIKIFEDAVARSLFCRNTPLSNDPTEYIDSEGKPACNDPELYVRQRHRVKVMTVTEGSIVVDFFLARNQTVLELPAPGLFQDIQRMLEEKSSPLCQDMEFGKFAKVAVIEEIPLSHLSEDELQQAYTFERMREAWGEDTACQLLSDAREGNSACPPKHAQAGSARRSASLLFTFATLLTIFASML
eukprot:TRINITY_DN30064_c0_g1_i1.p1 TRINITY_DN30064_c0_g1~~TRINITY_DN30064_c0_g1_i1.p1  ORF type:complete len:678 (-),score=94.08 TRINITY_DN30064_c0_g1_i1:74-2107(-)